MLMLNAFSGRCAQLQRPVPLDNLVALPSIEMAYKNFPL